MKNHEKNFNVKRSILLYKSHKIESLILDIVFKLLMHGSQIMFAN